MVVKRGIFSILLVLALSWIDLPSVRAQLIIVPKTQRYAPRRAPQPVPNKEEPQSQSATNAATNTVVIVTNWPRLVRVEPKPDPAKIASEKEAVLKNTVEWEKSRANEGSAWAQYKLGLRYLTGDGVEKNEITARKWLQAAADNGESQARSKLKVLDSSGNSASAPNTQAGR